MQNNLDNGNNKKFGTMKKIKAGMSKTKHKFRNYFSAKGADIYTRFLRRIKVFTVVSLLVGGVIVLIVLTIARIGSPVTKVPSVSGLDIVQASIELEKQGLIVGIDGKFSEQQKKFIVLSQYPKQGLTVRKGRTVRLLVSMGKDIYVVPNLVGMHREQAEELLRDKNIPFEITILNTDSAQTNAVISQDIKPGKEVDRSQKLKILVNSDIRRNEFRVENYVNRPADYAVRTLFENGIVPHLKKTLVDEQEKDGMILAQSVEQSTIIKKNSGIDLDVGVYGEDDVEKTKFDYHIFKYYIYKKSTDGDEADTSSMKEAEVKITIQDELGEEQEIMNKTMKYGKMVIVTFKSFGRTRLYLIINNNFVKEVSYGN